jgi:glycosyltransferase involved in cell wall biosynthesis
MARDAGCEINAVLVGDGIQRRKLENLAHELRLDGQVRFVGAMPFEEGLGWYQWADCLVLPSVHSEGWPKVLAEAMCHGLACIAVRHGQISQMLDGRGILLEKGTADEIAEALVAIAEQPDQFTPKMQAAARWSRQYSLPRLRDALASLIAEEWGAPIGKPSVRNAASLSGSEPHPRDCLLQSEQRI